MSSYDAILDVKVGRHRASVRHVEGERPPIVLLHGAGCDRHIFDELVRHLTPFELIVPDLPGRGGTDVPLATTAHEAAAFVIELLDAMGIERAIILGHSYGGAVAIEFALSAKERALGLVLVSTGARLRVHPAILAAMDAAAEAGPRSLPTLPWLPGTERALIEETERHVTEVPSKTTAADWHAANAFDRMAHVKDIDCPALIVTGAQDPLTRPKYARWLLENLRDARLGLVEGAGHMLPVENARELAGAVLAWVEDRFGQGF